jgi:nanoRNase/pAp phosphatase (c-di-AMP/oligoRNAs hydrolase)
MAELCQRVASKYMGQGGGHDRAGAAAIPKSQDLRLRRLMRDVVRTISEMLNQRLRKVRPR